MTRQAQKLLLAVLCPALFLAAPVGAREPLQFSGKVVGVSDGDTIVVLKDNVPMKVRLSDIDCPEKSQAYGQKAKQFTSRLCFGKTVALDVRGKDRYGRLIARVKLSGGKSLNQQIIQSGMGWTYRKYSEDTDLLSLEQKARQRKTGLWADSQPEPPWEFRKARSNQAN